MQLPTLNNGEVLLIRMMWEALSRVSAPDPPEK